MLQMLGDRAPPFVFDCKSHDVQHLRSCFHRKSYIPIDAQQHLLATQACHPPQPATDLLCVAALQYDTSLVEVGTAGASNLLQCFSSNISPPRKTRIGTGIFVRKAENEKT